MSANPHVDDPQGAGDRRLRRRLGPRIAAATLLALAVFAVAADLIASDLPLYVRVGERRYLLPCLSHPVELLDEDNQSLALAAARIGGVVIATPIPFGPLDPRHGAPLESPSRAHLLGTDAHGRDVAARILHALRTALLLGALTAALALFAGVVVGLGCAASRSLDRVLGRVVEVMLTFPTFFLLLAVSAALGSRRAPSVTWVAAAIAMTRWPDVARLLRVEALRVLALPHVEAARAMGARRVEIALRHVLPFASGPALTAAAFAFVQAILVETGLTFLGFGVPPPTPSFGAMLADAEGAGLPWWLLIGPAVIVTALLASSQSLADSWRSPAVSSERAS